jgi:hypothetical protein
VVIVLEDHTVLLGCVPDTHVHVAVKATKSVNEARHTRKQGGKKLKHTRMLMQELFHYVEKISNDAQQIRDLAM